MNKRIGFIAVMLAVLAGLGTALFFLSRPPAVSPNDAAPAALEYVYDAGGARSLAAVTVSNSSGEYTLRGGANSGNNPVIAGFEDVAMDTYSLNRVLDTAVRLVSKGLVTGEAADLAVFGLDPPQARCGIQPVAGETTELLVGSPAPDGVNVYVKLAGKAEIHLAASYEAELFLKGPLDFAGTGITPQTEQSQQTGELSFEKIILGGLARRGEAITIINTGPGGASDSAVFAGSPCRITSPVDAKVSADKGIPPLEALFGLSADRIAARIAHNGELARYGLAEPWSTAEVTGKPGGSADKGPGNFSLRVSKPGSTGMVYIRREGSPLIYEAAAAKLPWLELSWFDLMEKMIILPFIDNIASVEIKTPERSVSFSLAGEGDDLQVKAGGADIEVKNFRSYYQTLIGAMYDEYSDASAAALPPPFLSIIYHYRDSGKSADTVSFHHASSRRVLTSLNRGKPHFTLSAYTDKVLADLDMVLAGQRVRSYL